MAKTNYPLDLLSPVRHVATELDRVAPAALSLGDLAGTYRHPISSDLARIKSVEGCETDRDAILWIIDQAISELKDQVKSNGGGITLAKPFDELRYRRSKLVRLVATDDSDEKRALRALTNALREGDTGLRRVDPKRIEAIRQSIAEHGQLPGHPVLVSRRRGGEVLILDGRHRLQVDPDWPRLNVTGKTDEELLLIARNANAQDTLGQPWSKKDLEHLDSRLQAAGVIGSSHEAKREAIRQELSANASQSDREIGRKVGADNKTVKAVRSKMEETEEIPQFRAEGGRGVTTGTRAPSQPASEPEPEEQEPEPKPFTETETEGPPEERYEAGATRRAVGIIITDTEWAEFVKRAKPSSAAMLGELVRSWLNS